MEESNLARPKGSKNKIKLEVIIKEKEERHAQLAEEIKELKEKQTELKTLEKEIKKLKAEQIKQEEKAAEEARKAELDQKIKEMLASGLSAGDILEKLK